MKKKWLSKVLVTQGYNICKSTIVVVNFQTPIS